jgi:hypothetical protein
MNIFLDKSLPKRTRILLQILRVVLLIIIFGSFFYATMNPAAQDVLVNASIGLAIILVLIRTVIQRRKKNLSIKEQTNNFTERNSDQY